MPVRKFNGSSDGILTAAGGIAAKEAITLAALVKVEESSTYGTIIAPYNSGLFIPEIFHNGANGEVGWYQNNPSEVESVWAAAGLVPANGWVLLVATKAAGTTKPKFYRYVFSTGTLTSAEGSVTAGNRTVAVSSVYIGNNGGAGEYFKGLMGALAVWNVALTEAQVKELFGAASLEGWKSIASPQALWLFDQASVTEELQDIIGAADQTSRSGTTVAAEEPPIPYAASGKTVEGKATGTASFSGSAKGLRTRLGKATGASTFTGLAEGLRTRLGKAVGVSVFSGSAHGQVVEAEPEGPTRRVIVNREHPPSKIAVLVKAEDDTRLGRWAEDESSIENVLSGFTKTGDMPGGHGESGCSLARDPKRSYPDLGSFAKYEVQGAGGEKLWQGTIRQQPQSDGERISIEPKAVGDKQFLEDDEAVVGPGFISKDLSKWSEPTTQRRINLLSASYAPAGVSASSAAAGAGSAEASLIWDFTSVNKASGTPYPGAEMWFDGDGVLIGGLIFDQHGDTSTTWTKAAGLSPDDLAVAGTVKTSPNYSGIEESAGQGLSAEGSAFTHAYFQAWYTGTFVGQMTNLWRVANVTVLGDQELPHHGVWPNIGYLAKQMIPFIIEGSGLTTKDELLEDDEFIIPQAWFSEPATRMSKLVEVTKYGLLDWFVFNDRILQYRKPSAYGRKWRLSPGSGAPKNSGPDTERIFDRLMVSWQDVDGTTKTAGPAGSGAQFTDSRLQITDERNAAVAAKRPRGKLLALNGTCELEPAIRVGMRFLEEAQNLAQSGEATITGYCQDQYGIWYPAAYVQPGDWAADPGTQNYRKITNVNYSHDSVTASVTLGAPPEGLGALESRFSAKLIELGLS